MKLYIERFYTKDYEFGRMFEGYVIVDKKGDLEWYAKAWSMRVAKVIKKALEKTL